MKIGHQQRMTHIIRQSMHAGQIQYGRVWSQASRRQGINCIIPHGTINATITIPRVVSRLALEVGTQNVDIYRAIQCLATMRACIRSGMETHASTSSPCDVGDQHLTEKSKMCANPKVIELQTTVGIFLAHYSDFQCCAHHATLACIP